MTFTDDQLARLRDLPCRDFVELVTDYLEQRLDTRLRDRVDAHLSTCEGCHSYLEQMQATVDTLGRLPGERGLSPAVGHWVDARCGGHKRTIVDSSCVLVS